jgi:hypothetical protein
MDNTTTRTAQFGWPWRAKSKRTLCQVNSTTAAGPLDILIFKESFGVAWRAACRYECTKTIVKSSSKLS